MGESKLPLFAYVDETGNTGHNLFDEVQPDFFTAALITRGNFDIHYAGAVNAIASELGTPSLHGKELGLKRIEPVAQKILDLLQASRAHFFVSRVEKKYLLATKMFDSIFDSGENAAVAWHHYNFKGLRLILAFKLAYLIEDDVAQSFWNCILEKSEARSKERLAIVCDRLLANINDLPDARSREVIGAGLVWARDHPESIHIQVDRKIARQGHFPNMVAFGNLLAGLDEHSKRLRKSVARITHDQQSEFEATLKAWHDLFSNASPEEIRWVEEVYTLQKVVGSTFETKQDSDSPGIQIVDVVLWLYSQFQKEKRLPPGCHAILMFVFQHGWESDFSFAGVERNYLQKYGPILRTAIAPEVLENGRKLLNEMEAARLRSMAQYDADRITPFLRSLPSDIEP